jgi:translocation and assembly module TamB
MRRAVRIVFGLLALLVTLGTAALLVLVYLLHAPQGLQWAYHLAAARLPGELSIDQLSGRLAGPLTLQGVHYRHDGTELHVRRLNMQWRPGDLLKGEFHIDDLEVAGMELHTAPSAPKNGRPKLPDIHLPVGIDIGQARFSDLNLNGTRLDSIELRGLRFRQDQLQVRRLAVAAPRFRLSVEGKVSPRDGYPLDATLQWSAQDGRFGTLRGEGRLRGDLKRLQVEQRLTAPLRAELTGTVNQLLGDLSWQARLSVPSVDLRHLRPDWPALSLGGTVESQGDLQHVRLQGQLRSRYQNLDAEHRFAAAYHDGTLQLSRLDTTLPGPGIRLHLEGTVRDLRTVPTAALTGSWQGLRWPLQGTAEVRSAQGKLSLDGGLAQYHLQMAGDVAGPRLPAANWTLQADGTPQQLEVNRLTLHTLGGALTAQGRFGWRPALHWQATVQGKDINPGARWPAWPGRLTFSAGSEGQIKEGKPAGQVTLSKLTGQLRSFPVQASGRLSMQGDHYQIAGLRVNADANRLSVEGHLDQDWDVRWQLEAPALGKLVGDGGGGRLRGSGELRGPRNRPLISAELSGGQLQYGQYHIANADLKLVLDLRDQVPSRIDLSTQDIALGPRRLTQVTLHGQGHLKDHRLQLSMTAPNAALTLKAQGGYRLGQWQGSFTELTASASLLGSWRLASPAALTAAPSATHLDTLCLHQDQSRACVQGRWSATQGWQAQARLHAIPLVLFKPWLPSDISLAGKLAADARAEATAAHFITARAEIRIEAALLPPGLTMKQAGLGLHPTKLTFILDQRGLALRLQSELSGGGHLTGHIEVARAALPAPLGAGKADQYDALAGAVHGQIGNLGLLPAFIPGVEHTRGRLSASFTLGGSLDNPHIRGELRLENGSAVIPALGITPDAISLVIRGDPQGRLHIDASLHSQGTLHITGELRFDPVHGLMVQARASGERVQVMGTPEYHVLASPDLQLTVKGRRIEVDGEVFIPEANLRPRDLSGAISPSDDVVIVNAKGSPAATEPRWQIYSQIRLRLGDFVKFNGFGLKGLITGDLTLTETPQRPTTGRGELDIKDGEYKAYGQKLTIDRGRLLFFGAEVGNPGLDIRAVRQVQQVTAGIQVSGSLKSPKLQVFSEPAMSQGDALSYLLLGQPINQTSSAQGQQLYGAALSLGLAGSGLLANQIGQRFGIDELGVESGGSFGGGALVLRHYLSPRLYISYGIGLVERLNVFSIRYQISRLWSLDAQSGAQSGADLVYTLERE